MEESDPTEIENLTAKSSTNKPTFKRTIVRNNFSINDNFRYGPLYFSLNICGIPISPFQYRKCLALVLNKPDIVRKMSHSSGDLSKSSSFWGYL
jgi:hypothetical protein